MTDYTQVLDQKRRTRPTADTASGPRVVVRTLRELRQNPDLLQPPTAVVDRFAYAGRVTLLAAREKDGKSTLAGSLAATVSRAGSDALLSNLEEHPGEVVSRFATFGANEDRVHVVDTLPEALKSIKDAVERVHPALVVVDTLPALVQGLVRDPGNAAEWTPVLRRLTALARESNAAVLLLHHARKSDGTYRDSTAVGANADVILEMARVEGDPAARLFRPKARWPMEPFTLRLVDNRYVLGSGSVSVETLALSYVQANPGCSLRAVREGVERKGTEVDANLDRLMRQGLIRDEGKNGHHAYVAVHQTPVPE